MSVSRASRVKMRSRPIDCSKPLFLSDTSVPDREPSEEEAIELAMQATSAGPQPSHSGGNSHHGHHPEGGTIAGVGIPTPPIFHNENWWKALSYKQFRIPSHYIKSHLTPGFGLLNAVDRYDLLNDDIDWLKSYNQSAEAKRLPTMSEQDLERMLDLFEHEAGKITVSGMRAEMMSLDDKIDPSKDFPQVRAVILCAQYLHIRNKLVEPAFEYWIDKRKRLGKALMRQFQEPPPRGNTDPHVAFRPRSEGRRISKRNPRKDDASAYHKMHYLKRDFQKVVDIIDLMQTREILKREASLMSTHIFDHRLHATPWAKSIVAQYPAIAPCLQNPSLVTQPSVVMQTSALATESAIYTEQAINPPASFLAPVTTLPLSSTSLTPLNAINPPPPPPPAVGLPPDADRYFRLLKSALPPATYSKSEMDAQAQLKKNAKRPVKRPATTVPIRRPMLDSHGRPVDKMKQESSLHIKKKLPSAQTSSTAPNDDDVMDDHHDMTDSEELLSEDEDDIAFFNNINAYVKRVKLSEPSVKTEFAQSSPSVSPSTSPQVSPKLFGRGRVRGVVSRAGRLLLEYVTPDGSFATAHNSPPFDVFHPSATSHFYTQSVQPYNRQAPSQYAPPLPHFSHNPHHNFNQLQDYLINLQLQEQVPYPKPSRNMFDPMSLILLDDPPPVPVKSSPILPASLTVNPNLPPLEPAPHTAAHTHTNTHNQPQPPNLTLQVPVTGATPMAVPIHSAQHATTKA